MNHPRKWLAFATTAACTLLLFAGCPDNSEQTGDPNTAANDGVPADYVGSIGTLDTTANDGACDDGAIGLATDLTRGGAESGEAIYHEMPDGCREFVLRLSGFAAGSYSVTIGGASAGEVTLDSDADITLAFNSDAGNFPDDFRTPHVGDLVDVGGLASGVLAEDCPAAPIVCGAGGQVASDDFDEANTPAVCGEDASLVVEVIVELDSVQMRPSTCTVVKQQLETRMATVRFRNTDPTRTIAISAILIERSDKQNLSPSPCENFKEGQPSITDDDCLKSLAMGCNSPSSLFIGPGEESIPWTYECLTERIFPGSGACGDQELETRRTSVLAQAVFCDDFDAAQIDFCDNADRHLILAGQPSNRWNPIESDECP
ncbi:MAG: hypothetical protein D6744_14765 [Planctomycetota bacterium]|nr:MAG: hypothetical protein D6744_14765 [Planctomycetota bacterium]